MMNPKNGSMVAFGDHDDDIAPLWKYVTKIERLAGGGNWSWQCNYCNDLFKSSHTRVKAHLLHSPLSGIRHCKGVKEEDVIEMRRVVEHAEMRERAKKAKCMPGPLSVTIASVGRSRSSETKKRRVLNGNLALVSVSSSNAREELDSLIARMFYSAGLPFQLAKNPYFIRSFAFAANNLIPGYVPPSYEQLSTTLLQREKSRIEKMFEPVGGMWKDKGVSIVTNGWSEAHRKPIINVLAVSDGKAMFLNAVNTKGKVKDESFIASILVKAIQEVGAVNVVQVMTDYTPVCRAAGLIVEKMYPHVYWSPCVVHALDVALKKICAAKNAEVDEVVYEECKWIGDISRDVEAIRNFLIKHPMKSSIFYDYVELKLLAFLETRFAFGIIILRKIKALKNSLLDLVTSEKWSSYKEKDEGKALFVKQKLLDDIWWEKIEYIVSFTEPIYDMLRSTNTDKPNLHFVYDMWDTMIEKVKSIIYLHEGRMENEESSFYSTIHAILIDQWTGSNTPLHCLAHSLNPKFYSSHWLTGARVAPHMDEEVSKERAVCMKRYFPNAEKRRLANLEYANFSAALDAFADDDSLNDRWLMDPKVWWIVYGSFAPLLQGLALKLLGQPCSSSGCEKNWSTYSFVNSIKRKNMNSQQANDLLYVHTNLRLLSRKSPEYHEGETKMWDIGGDEFGSFGVGGILDVANLSLDEPELESVFFREEENYDNIDGESMDVGSS